MPKVEYEIAENADLGQLELHSCVTKFVAWLDRENTFRNFIATGPREKLEMIKAQLENQDGN